jgi:hypothetical protein
LVAYSSSCGITNKDNLLVMESVHDSVRKIKFVNDSIRHFVKDSVCCAVKNFIEFPIDNFIDDSVWASIYDSIIDYKNIKVLKRWNR